MTTPRDPDRLIRAFLAEGPEALPDRTYDTVRGDIDRTRQRVAIGPGREPDMNNVAKLAIALAAVVVVAIVGLNLLPGQGSIGGIAPTPSPTPSATPPPAPAATASASPVVQYLPPVGSLAAGTYPAISEFDLVQFSFTVPEGWKSEGWFLSNDLTGNQYGLRLTFVPVGNLYADPCREMLMAPAVGPSVDDLATALTTLPGTTPRPIQDIVIDGRDAKLVEYTIDEGHLCLNSRFILWSSPADGVYGSRAFHTGPGLGSTVRTWILDVGGDRFVMTADIMPWTSEADRAELQDVVDSVTFGE